MSKLEQLTAAAAQLSDDELDDLLAHVQHLSSGSAYANAPPAVKASIERGLAERDAGLGMAANEVFVRLQAKLDAAGR